MNLLLYSSLLLYLLYLQQATSELSKTCRHYYKYHTMVCSNLHVSHAVHLYKRREWFRKGVKDCFSNNGCSPPTFPVTSWTSDTTVISKDLQTKVEAEFKVSQSRLNCMRPKLHEMMTQAITDCRREKTGKTAGEIDNIVFAEDERRKRLYDALQVVSTLRGCPPDKRAIIKQCVDKDQERVRMEVCKNTKICHHIIKAVKCQPEVVQWRREICDCYERVKQFRHSRTGSGNPGETANILGAVGNLAKIFIPGAGNALGGNGGGGLGGLGSGLGGGGLTNLLSKISGGPLPAGLGDFGEYYGLSAGEVNATLGQCNNVRKSEFAGTYRDIVLRACDCNLQGLEGQKVSCLNQPGCLGQFGYDNFVNALAMLKGQTEKSHLDFFCGCGDEIW